MRNQNTHTHTYTEMARPLPWLLPLLAMAILQLTAGSMAAPRMALPNCPDKCGDVSIPYPFGVSKDCSREGFGVECNDSTAYVRANNTLRVLNISLLQGETRVLQHISRDCYTKTDLNESKSYALNLSDHVYRVSNTKNKFTAIGCSTLGFILGEGENIFVGVCASTCQNDSVDTSGQCSGSGCCQIPITGNPSFFQIQFLSAAINNTFVLDFNPCSYAFVVDEDWFHFNHSYLEDHNFANMHSDGVPLVLDWVAGNESCVEAKTKKSYACRAMDSICYNASNGPGYRCNCSDGYEGNPYLEGGCQDINECESPWKYPCHGTCSNTEGNYTCSCPRGTESFDPKSQNCTRKDQLTSKVVIGISISIIFLLVCVFALLIECQNRKLVKEKDRFFQQNGGLLLYDQIRSKQVDTVRILTNEELQKATNNFDKSRELGRGGHGTVYKGILKDNRVVAIKRSKISNVTQKDEFVQEMIILSQLNHKNVVRLLGCCLEVEVPMLVYEFISKGTLFELIHGKYRRSSISLDGRLRIALESAEALAYLHSSASPPIVHGDVKSPNILLDDNYTAKVTDFGASRMLAKDEAQFMTIVQGTLGYLDPEYLQERQLTEKSDVYSFGVVLLELITRKTAIYSEGPAERKNLASSFLLAMKEKKLQDILDKNIMGVGMELLQEIAELAKQCLSVKGEERPSMTQVADKLKIIRSTWRELLTEHNADETESLLENSSAYHPSSTAQHGSLMTLELETGR